jgi:hypothetical protein
MHQDIEEHWDLIILPRNRLFNLQLRELWRYRDLMLLFVKRDFIAQYKQTILGPLWHFINPIFTTVTYTIIFGNIAQLSTDGTPRLVFYMKWNHALELLLQHDHQYGFDLHPKRGYFRQGVLPQTDCTACHCYFAHD